MKKGLLTLFLFVFLAACSTAAPLATETSAPTYTPTNSPDDILFQPPESGIYEGASLSPDGKWIAWKGFASDFEHMPHVLIQNELGTVRYIISQMDPDIMDTCRQSCILGLAHWSSDSRYAYIDANIPRDGASYVSANIVQLIRVDLETGEQKYLISGDTTYYDFAFSSDDRMFAYVFRRDLGEFFVIEDWQTGLQTVVENKNEEIEYPGVVVWMPDYEGLVFSTFDEYDDNLYSIWYFDLDKLTFQKLFQTTGCFSIETEWLSEDKLQYTCWGSGTEGKSLILNATTLQVQVLNE